LAASQERANVAIEKANTLGRWPANLIHDGSEEPSSLLGSAARFFYCAKASKADRSADNRHPTVKPTALMRYLCRLVTPPGGVVLDPFTGSGSTGKAAVSEGFDFVGIEREAEYVEIARARIAAAVLPLEATA
jgi:site-specific DNA-methyltransferase (adenine-specific)